MTTVWIVSIWWGKERATILNVCATREYAIEWATLEYDKRRQSFLPKQPAWSEADVISVDISHFSSIEIERWDVDAGTAKCPYTHSHTRQFCGHSTCRES